MKERRQPETLRLRSLMPSLTVNDLATSRAWYRDVLGFIVAEEFRHEDRLVGVRMTARAVDFLLGQTTSRKAGTGPKAPACGSNASPGRASTSSPQRSKSAAASSLRSPRTSRGERATSRWWIPTAF